MNQIIEELKNDKRFYIDDWNLERITKKEIYKYKLIYIPVKKIRRYLNAKVFSLTETDVYKYLNDAENETKKNNYINYCKNYCGGNANRSIESFNNLIENMNKYNYDPKKGIIVVDQNYFIVEGQHRSCFLLKKYGPNKKIEVLKIYYKNNTIITIIRNMKYNLLCFFKRGNAK